MGIVVCGSEEFVVEVAVDLKTSRVEPVELPVDLHPGGVIGLVQPVLNLAPERGEPEVGSLGQQVLPVPHEDAGGQVVDVQLFVVGNVH
jgi:hypothetical protein